MDDEKHLNTDVPGRISELQAAMKEFLLKHKLYKILLRGKGLEFEAYRTYSPDDDSTTIDWKASKRANALLVKQYREERDLKIVFIVDVGENMVFGSTEKLKCEYATEVVGAFSHLIITTGDRVGAVFFSDKVKDYLKPSGGTRHFSRLVSILNSPGTYGGASNVNEGFDFALNYLNRSIASIVVVSDFISFNKESEKKLALLASKFETVLLMVRDPLDRTLPENSGEVVVEDPKSGQQLLVNPKIVKAAYEKIALEQEKTIKALCEKQGVDFLELITDKPFVPSLSEFLKGRAKQRGAIK